MQRKYCFTLLQGLQIERESLVAAITTAEKEISECVSQGIEPISSLAMAIWTLSPAELHIFSFSVALPDLQAWCQSWTSHQNGLQSLCARFTPPQRKTSPISLQSVV